MKTAKAINHSIEYGKKSGRLDTNQISDTYHTFGELYEHRVILFIALCNTITGVETNFTQPNSGLSCWKSKLHSDGTSWDGWFIAGINTKEGKQISYHLPMDKWDLLDSYERDQAPGWDGHTPADVIERLLKL